MGALGAWLGASAVVLEPWQLLRVAGAGLDRVALAMAGLLAWVVATAAAWKVLGGDRREEREPPLDQGEVHAPQASAGWSVIPGARVVAPPTEGVPWPLARALVQELAVLEEQARRERPRGRSLAAVLTPSEEQDQRAFARLTASVAAAPASLGQLIPLRSGELIGTHGPAPGLEPAGRVPLRVVDRLGQLCPLPAQVALVPGEGLQLILQHRVLPWLVGARLVVVGYRAEELAGIAARGTVVASGGVDLGTLLREADTSQGGGILVVVTEGALGGGAPGALRGRLPGAVIAYEDARLAELSLPCVDLAGWRTAVEELSRTVPLAPFALPPAPERGRAWVRLTGGRLALEGIRASLGAAALVATLGLAGGEAPEDELARALDVDIATVRQLVAGIPAVAEIAAGAVRLREGIGSDLGLLHRVTEVDGLLDVLVAPPLADAPTGWLRARRPALEARVVDLILDTAWAIFEQDPARPEPLLLARATRRVFGPLARVAQLEAALWQRRPRAREVWGEEDEGAPPSLRAAS